jgi:lysophospholipase L1-like esterase
MLKRIAQKGVYLFFLITFLLSSQVVPVFAKPLDDPLSHAFYERSTCSVDAAAASAPLNGNKVYLLGDSLLVGSYYTTGYLKNNLDDNKWVSTADGSAGRALTTGGSDPGNTRPGHEKSGLDAIEVAEDKDAIQNADSIVIELGTNTSGSASQFGNQMKQLLDRVKTLNPHAKLFWVNIVSTSDSIYSSYNNKIEELSDPENYTVIDAKSKKIELQPGGLRQMATRPIPVS